MVASRLDVSQGMVAQHNQRWRVYGVAGQQRCLDGLYGLSRHRQQVAVVIINLVKVRPCRVTCCNLVADGVDGIGHDLPFNEKQIVHFSCQVLG